MSFALSQTTFIAFLSAGAFAFAGASFMKTLLLNNSKKVFQEIKKTDKHKQIKIRKFITGIYLGVVEKEDELDSYKKLQKSLKRKLRKAISEYDESTEESLSKEFSKHQSNSFSFGLFGLGYLLLLMLYTTGYLIDVNLLFIYVYIYFIYSVYNLFGIYSFVFVLFFSTLPLDMFSEFNLIIHAILGIVFSVFYVCLLKDTSSHLGITKTLSKSALKYIYREVQEKNINIVISKNMEHYIGIFKYLIHFLVIMILFFIVITCNALPENPFTSFCYIYDFNNHPSTLIAFSLLIYIFMTVFYPAYKLNKVFRDITIKYIAERDSIWEEPKFEPLIKLKVNYDKYEATASNIFKNINDKFNN